MSAVGVSESVNTSLQKKKKKFLEELLCLSASGFPPACGRQVALGSSKETSDKSNRHWSTLYQKDISKGILKHV